VSPFQGLHSLFCLPSTGTWIIHHIHFKKRMALCINDLDRTSADFVDNTVSKGEKSFLGVAPPGLASFFQLTQRCRAGLTSGAGATLCQHCRAPHEYMQKIAEDL